MPKIHIAHSPDADDAFMFAPLFQGKVDRGSLEIVDVQEDIESLNQKAIEGTYEVSAVSFHVLPSIAEKYLLLTTGACFGDRYGPVIVAKKPLKPKQLLKTKMGIPGKKTTAFLVFKLYEHSLTGEEKSGICYSEVPFDQIVDRIVQGKLDAGLLIHEGQLTVADKGLHKIVDLGEWWHQETGLPLPLGGLVVRRDLDPEIQRQIASLIRSSIQYALEHREETLQTALPFARGLDPERTSQFIEMYVNDLTVDFGRRGWRAIRKLFEKGVKAQVLTQKIDLENILLRESSTMPSSLSPAPEEPSSSAPSPETEKDVPSPDSEA